MTDIEALLVRFESEARNYFRRYQRRCLSPEGAAFVEEQLAAQCATVGRMLDVLELGAGFSTMVFGKSKSVRQLVSFEHDVAWAQFLAATLGLGPFIGRKGLALLGRFDVIFVDHGPEMSTRVDDLPWIVSRLTDDGLLLLDDWETRFVEDGPIYGGFTEASWRRLRELGDWGITVGGKCHHEAVLAARRK